MNKFGWGGTKNSYNKRSKCYNKVIMLIRKHLIFSKHIPKLHGVCFFIYMNPKSVLILFEDLL